MLIWLGKGITTYACIFRQKPIYLCTESNLVIEMKKQKGGSYGREKGYESG